MTAWSMGFPGKAECLADARRFTYAVIGETDEAHTVALVANELAGNAIKHTASGKPGGTFVLHLSTSLGRWRVRVDDQGGPKAPSICEANEGDESGRGLTIVAALSETWGVDGDETAWSVWADIAFDRAAADDRG